MDTLRRAPPWAERGGATARGFDAAAGEERRAPSLGHALGRLPYREVWTLDFEFLARDGERPEPVCLVTRELRSGRLLRLWRDELVGRPPRFRTDAEALFVAYYASAELGCFLALGWPMPARVLDLYCEFRAATNGLPTPCGAGLLGALQWHGLAAMAADEKKAMRGLVLRGGPWSGDERRAVLDYCQADVDALGALLPRMLPGILSRQRDPSTALGHALLRGRYMAAAARMEWTGVPVDTDMLQRLRTGWDGIKAQLVAEVDSRYGVYEGTTFKTDRFAAYLAINAIPWPRLPSGALARDEGAFKDMARAYPALQPLRELRHALGELRLEALAVGADGRNRTTLRAFSAKTGRNAPSNTRFIFGPATWLRSLIKPEPGTALAYVDFSSQEMGIAAALSGDPALLDAYRSGDVYLGFAKRAGLAPPEATKATHAEVRERCKAVVLGTLYGMGPDTLARRIGRPPCEARELLALHRAAYPRFWRWSEAAVTSFELARRIETAFGWPLHAGPEWNPRSVMNFPMQANGAEMLRLACCLATERGLSVCAPVHDAILIEAPLGKVEEHVAAVQGCMREASRVVLGGGLELGSEAKIVRWPERYADKRGEVIWDTVMRLLDESGDRAGGLAVAASA
jgi:DNA polymerase I